MASAPALTRSTTQPDSGTVWLLVLAHPGHELCAYHLLERVNPIVAVLTDGSGAHGVSRLDASRSLLAHIGAREAPVFGALTDRDAYRALLDVDSARFAEHIDRLVDVIGADRVGAVVVDSAEGYNPVHDVCHWMTRAAVLRARAQGNAVELFELDLVSHPNGSGDGLRLALDDDAFERKLSAVYAYRALAGEADAAFARHGRDAFRTEFLRRVDDAVGPPASWVPYYEEVGAARVRSGQYSSVVTYASHVRPVIESLIGVIPQPQAAGHRHSLHQ